MKQYTPEELAEIYRKMAGAGLWVPLSNIPKTQVSGPAVEVYLRYSDVVPQASTVAERYWNLLQQVPATNAVGVLAFINNILATRGRDVEVHRILNERFLPEDLRRAVASNRPGGPAFSVVFTRTGCFQLMRHLMLYGNDSAGESDVPVETVGELALFSNEFLQTDWLPTASTPDAVEVALQFVPNWDIDNPADLAYALARMFTILTQIHPGADAEVRNLSSEIGIDSSAVTVDELLLIDFVSVVFGIYSFALEVEKKGAQAAIFDYKRVFEKIGFPLSSLEMFMASRSLTLAEFKNRLGGKRPAEREKFDDEVARRPFLIESLNVFRQCPILRLDAARAIILDIQFLVELLTSGVYWNLFDGLPPKRREVFRQLWGRLFELYVVGLLREFYPPASGILAADIFYGGGQIDALLDFGIDVFVFEIESSLLTEKAKRGRIRNDFEADVKLKFVRNERGEPKALVQLAKSCQALLSGKLSTATEPKRIYPVLVSDEPAVSAFCFNQYLNEIFQAELGNSSVIRPLTAMSINEFEDTLAYVSQSVFTWDELLQNRFIGSQVDVLSMHQTVYNYRRARGVKSCRNAVLLERFERVYGMIKSRYQPS